MMHGRCLMSSAGCLPVRLASQGQQVEPLV